MSGEYQPPGSFESAGLSKKTEKQIIKDYRKYRRDLGVHGTEILWIARYYGTYNDCVAVSIGRDWSKSLSIEIRIKTIGGVEFKYSPVNKITVWKDGKIYDLEKAYDLGFLSTEDLQSMAYYHKNGGKK